MRTQRSVFLSVCSMLLLSVGAIAQFNSGSTGADGALDLSTMTCPNNVCYVQLPESGILNYTTVNIAAGKTLRFIVNSRNTPVTLLAQGSVSIDGTISVSAVGQYSCGPPAPYGLGPGGFRGGQVGLPGFGPGAGQPGGVEARWVGPLSLVPIVGGSGGAGVNYFGDKIGGNGGGAITIASSVSIISSSSSRIEGKGDSSSNCSWAGRGGSGGAIRLVSDTITYSGSLDTTGAVSAGKGVIRIEATNLTFSGTANPAAVLSTINSTVVSGALPQLTIQSVGGYSVPSYSGTRFDTVDLLLPNQIPDPVNVSIGANNMPTGTQVDVGFVSGSASATSTSCNLSGTFESSTCTATISNLTRPAVTYLLATAAFTPPTSLAKYNPKGRNQVATIRLETVLGAKPKYVFLGKNKNVIETSKIKKEFLLYFGM